MKTNKMHLLHYLTFLITIKGAGGIYWSVRYNQEHLCVLKGSTVFMNGTFTHPAYLTGIRTFWFIMREEKKEPADLRDEAGYRGRVKYFNNKQNHFSLRLSNVQKSDKHVYRFRIITDTNHQKWSGEPGVSVSVTDLKVMGPTEVTEGQPAVLTCNTTCSLTDPTFIWYKNGRDLNPNTIKNNKFHLQSVSSEDAGRYSCAVRGSEQLCSPNRTLSVRYPPKNISVSISSFGEVVEGSSVTLTCSSDANPSVEIYTWFKGMNSFGEGKNFTFSKIRSEDSGEYKCQCRNKVGHQMSSGVSLNVLYPPKNISVSISSFGEVVEGSSVTLTCSSDANPSVKIYTWFKGNESSPVGSEESYRAVQSGHYYCEVQNEHGSQRSSSVFITVHGFSNVGAIAGGATVVIVGVCVMFVCFFLRKMKTADQTVDQSSNQDNLYSSVAEATPISTDANSALANPDEVLYATVVPKKAPGRGNAKGAAVKASSSYDEDVQYASVRFTRTSPERRISSAEDPSKIYSNVK